MKLNQTWLLFVVHRAFKDFEGIKFRLLKTLRPVDASFEVMFTEPASDMQNFLQV